MSKIVIANWKMSLGLKETEDLTQEIIDGLEDKDLKCNEVVLCPSFTALKEVGDIIKKNKLPVFLGAQDVFWQEKGAYTGEVSEAMLRELGVKYIIIGHSERRINLGETDEMINKKIKIVLEKNLIPIVCIGETMEQRQNNETNETIKNQLSKAMANINPGEDQKIIIAYEPVWAISINGHGQIVEPREAAQVIALIKKELKNKNNFTVIYGGSVDSKNISNFIENKIEGFLVGGASLKAQELIKMVKTTNNSII